MPKHGKTIKLFLIDGAANGIVSCELSNWTGKAYKIPRVRLKDCVQRTDLNNPGVYLLLGKDEDGNDSVYVGEAETILKRINQHIQKDFWNEAIVFISKDENLNKAHIKYLESRLCDIAKTAGRYSIDNSTTPTQSSISESDKSEMEEFIENVRLLVNTLGHKLFDDKREFQKTAKDKKGLFFIKAARGADAEGEPTSDGFLVFKNSHAANSLAPSTTQNYVKLRGRLEGNGVLVMKGDNCVFSVDHLFSSPSSAASIVLGRCANGLTEWKNNDGLTLKKYQSIK